MCIWVSWISRKYRVLQNLFFAKCGGRARLRQAERAPGKLLKIRSSRIDGPRWRRAIGPPVISFFKLPIRSS